jgi:hypothetical protein
MALAEAVLDGRDGGEEVAAGPRGRAAFVERLAAVLAPPRPAAAPPHPAAAPPRPVERLRDDLRGHLAGGLLRLELRGDPARGETLLAVVERADDAVRAAVAERLARHYAGATAPVLVVIDGAAFEALGRLEAAGIAQLASPAEILHDSRAASGASGASGASAASAADAERRRRAVRAREAAQPAARKVRMAAVLAGGGFPIEGLAPLREGVEGGFAALAELDGAAAPQPEERAPDWLAARLAGHDGIDPAIADLAARLSGGAAALLTVGEEEARAWIAAGERFTAELGALLQGVDAAGMDAATANAPRAADGAR